MGWKGKLELTFQWLLFGFMFPLPMDFTQCLEKPFIEPEECQPQRVMGGLMLFDSDSHADSNYFLSHIKEISKIWHVQITALFLGVVYYH